MTKYPIKMLLDEKKNPFFPVITTDSVLVNGTEQTAADLFADRYTKAEIDKIIADLGTLQRLCGKVDSVESLPNNARPGDTYIVTGVSGNSSEYMYIGDKWEELGPMVDLSGYDTSEEVDTKLSSLRDNVNETAEANSAEALRQAKQYTDTKAAALATDALTDAKAYTDDVVSQTGTVDMSNYYTKEQADESAETIADEKIAAIPVNDLLHFKGHVNTIDDLPKGGQVSGETIEPSLNITGDSYTTPSSVCKSNVPRDTSFQYYVGLGSVYSDYDRTRCGCINTNYQDIFDGVCFGKTNLTWGEQAHIFIHVNASSTKFCKGSGYFWAYPDDGSDTISSASQIINKPCWILIQAGPKGGLYSNIDTELKFKYWDRSYISDWMYNKPVSTINNKTIIREDFIYNIGYKMFKFDLEGDEHAITVKETSSDIIENHVYTVGENKDLYRANEVDQKWELLSASVSIEEVETLIDEKILGALEGSY